jgi:hypothetical protein
VSQSSKKLPTVGVKIEAPMLAGNEKEDIGANSGDDVLEVWTVNSSDPTTPPRKIRRRKRRKEEWGLRQNVNGDTVLRVPGPEKEKEDNGDESLERTDLQSLLVQGCMLTCFVTNGFFNLLSKRLYEEGCRRVHSTVLVELLRRRRENGEQSLEGDGKTENSR